MRPVSKMKMSTIKFLFPKTLKTLNSTSIYTASQSEVEDGEVTTWPIRWFHSTFLIACGESRKHDRIQHWHGMIDQGNISKTDTADTLNVQNYKHQYLFGS